MATVTLAADTDYSALTVADGDTIELAGYTLAMDAVPTEINVIVQTVGTAGKMTLLGSTDYPLTGWTMTAGSSFLIATVPIGTTLGGSLFSGTVAGAYGCSNNYGTIISITSGATYAVYGCNLNYGTITTCTAGTAGRAYGCNANLGTITTCTAGSVSQAYGCHSNYGTITTCTGGTTNGAYGCNRNYGTITTCTAGTTYGAYGCAINYGIILNITDGATIAVLRWDGSITFMFGPGVQGIVPANITTLYVLGALSGSATIDAGTTVTELSAAGGGGGIQIARGMSGGMR